jgi:hypothetical protein
MTQIGVINEVGDLGLGFTPLSEEDQQSVKESAENEKPSK